MATIIEQHPRFAHHFTVTIPGVGTFVVRALDAEQAAKKVAKGLR